VTGEAPVIKLMLAVILLVFAALVAGAYLGFSPAIPIFIILGFGIYMVGRIGGPPLPENAPLPWGGGHGIYMRGQDYAPPDTDSHSGGNFRDGVDPNDPSNAR
jgi:hypothetical protein